MKRGSYAPSVNLVLAFLIDRLPLRLWRPANLYVGMRLHFCIGTNDLGQTVRTVEWEGREVGQGRTELDPADIPEH